MVSIWTCGGIWVIILWYIKVKTGDIFEWAFCTTLAATFPVLTYTEVNFTLTRTSPTVVSCVLLIPPSVHRSVAPTTIGLPWSSTTRAVSPAMPRSNSGVTKRTASSSPSSACKGPRDSRDGRSEDTALRTAETSQVEEYGQPGCPSSTRDGVCSNRPRSSCQLSPCLLLFATARGIWHFRHKGRRLWEDGDHKIWRRANVLYKKKEKKKNINAGRRQGRNRSSLLTAKQHTAQRNHVFL